MGNTMQNQHINFSSMEWCFRHQQSCLGRYGLWQNAISSTGWCFKTGCGRQIGYRSGDGQKNISISYASGISKLSIIYCSNARSQSKSGLEFSHGCTKDTSSWNGIIAKTFWISGHKEQASREQQNRKDSELSSCSMLGKFGRSRTQESSEKRRWRYTRWVVASKRN